MERGILLCEYGVSIMKKILIMSIMFMLFVSSFYIQPPIDNAIETEESIKAESPNDFDKRQISSDPFMGETPIKANVLHGSMDDYYLDDYPEDWNIFGSTLSNTSIQYDGDAYEGTYSGYINALGDEHFTSYAYLYQYPYINISESKYLDVYYKIVKNSDPSSGSYAYIYFTLLSQSSTYFYLYYILSGTPTSLSNNSYTIVYDVNQSSSNWIHLQRNITADIENAFNTSNFMMRYLYFQVFCISNPTGPITALVDNFTIVNETGYNYIQNYNFESSGRWYETSDTGQVDFGKDTNAVEGKYSFRMECLKSENKFSELYLREYFSAQNTYYPNAFGDLILEFDWWYNATPNGGSDQYSIVYLTFRNSSYRIYLTYYLGVEENFIIENNETYSGSLYLYINKTINNQRTTWHHTILDLYDIFSEYNNISGLYLSEIRFYTRSSTYKNSTTTFMLDNIQLITDPVGNSEFEYHRYSPADCWYTSSNVNYTTDSMSGFAMNLTASGGNEFISHSDIYMEVSEDLYLMVGNKLSNISSNNYYVDILISLNNSYNLYYILSSKGSSFSNSSNYAYIILNSSTTSWDYTKMYLYKDAQIFGDKKYYITYVNVYLYVPSSSDHVSVYVDNFYFIKDSHGPAVNEITLSPSTPMYYTATTLTANITDFGGVSKANLSYTSSGGSGTLIMTKTGELFQAVLPVLPYGPVSYYIRAIDMVGHETLYNNGGANYTFMIGDDVPPEISIDSPLNNATLYDNYTIALNPTDAGSGINYVSIYLNATLVANVSAPYNYKLNTRNYINGVYVLKAVAYDHVGNTKESSIIIRINNDINAPIFDVVQIYPTSPSYRDDITIFVNMQDETNVSEAILYYNTGTTWINMSMQAMGSSFSATIPAQPYGTTIQYYIVARDFYGNVASYGSLSIPKSISIIDNILPVGFISAPANGSNVKGIVQIDIDANDPDYPQSSGIDKIEIYMDGTLVETVEQSSYVFSWDTTQLTNGAHTLTIKIYDKAQNFVTFSRTYTIKNPVGLDAIGEAGQSFMAQFGFFVGAGSVIAVLVIYRYIVLRKKKAEL